MNAIEKTALALLHRTDPERAHGLALRLLGSPLFWGGGPVTSPALRTDLAGMMLPNPVGLAAGFDKNARALRGLARTGFGFVEVGAVTPRPQPGNPKPRLFRLSEDNAVINRFGFNNEGMDAVAARLARRPNSMVVGINLGANKDSADRVEDFAQVLESCGLNVAFATVNVSSPNTERLRDLQGPEALRKVLERVTETRRSLATRPAIFLKIAPDLATRDLEDIASVALDVGLQGIIATNTTLIRDGLTSPLAQEQGGLSGAPLFRRSTRVLARLYAICGDKIPLIGVGGISSAEDAYAKIRAGARAVQLYSALVYQGISLAREIATGLETLIQRDGFTHVSQAVGLDHNIWLRDTGH